MKIVYIFILFVLIFSIGILYWRPWQTEESITNSISSQFVNNWQGIVDGCGLVKVEDVRRGFLGYSASIKYACGLKDPSQIDLTRKIFINPFGQIQNLPKPERR